ncbi:MAG: hypothetical protein JWR36_1513 [Glaciihabitans sp.]|nr:hypothetical protein [Glaciihabitans sp.]MDQ1569615.1 hypothetical protein [Actinomycetota bacterium]
MTTLRHKLVAPVAVLLALTMAPILTGCIGNPVQGIVKAATGGKVDVGDGHSLPSDFPKAVPVAKGTVVSGVGAGSGAKKIWNASVHVTGADPTDGIESDLKRAGFTIEPVTSTSDGSALIGATARYSVLIGIAKDKTGWLVNYTVGPADSQNSGN